MVGPKSSTIPQFSDRKNKTTSDLLKYVFSIILN